MSDRRKPRGPLQTRYSTLFAHSAVSASEHVRL
jgi:hypothetical protein